jgi:hypothetical protein
MFFKKENLISTPLPSLQTKKKDITLKRYFWGEKKRVQSGPSKGRRNLLFFVGVFIFILF